MKLVTRKESRTEKVNLACASKTPPSKNKTKLLPCVHSETFTTSSSNPLKAKTGTKGFFTLSSHYLPRDLSRLSNIFYMRSLLLWGATTQAWCLIYLYKVVYKYSSTRVVISWQYQTNTDSYFGWLLMKEAACLELMQYHVFGQSDVTWSINLTVVNWWSPSGTLLFLGYKCQIIWWNPQTAGEC